MTSRPDHRLECVGDRGAPGRHLLGLGTREVAEVLATDGVERAEHDDPLVGPPLEDRFQPGRQCEHALARAGAAAEAHDADLLVDEESMAMCCSADRPAEVEQRLIGADQVHPLVGDGSRPSADCEPEWRATPEWHGRSRASTRSTTRCSNSSSITEPHTSSSTNPVHPESAASSLRYSSASRPTTAALSRSGRSLVTTMTSGALAHQAQRHGQDPVVVRVGGERLRQTRRARVVQLDPQCAAFVVDRHRLQQRTVAGTQVFQEVQAATGGPAELGMMALRLELREHHQRQHHLVLGEPGHGQGIGQEYGGVDDIDRGAHQGTGDATALARAGSGLSDSRHRGMPYRCRQVPCLGWETPQVRPLGGQRQWGTGAPTPSSPASTRQELPRCSSPCRRIPTSRRRRSRKRGISCLLGTGDRWNRRRCGRATSAVPAIARCASKPHRRTSTAAPRWRRSCGSGWSTRTSWCCSANRWPRAISFFTYQKVRLRFPADLPIGDYLAVADRLGPDDFLDPANEPYMAFQGGLYADFLPEWLETFGTERLRIIDFAELIADPVPLLGSLADWLGLDPTRFPPPALSAENQTTGYRNKGLQHLALHANDRLERLLRRHPEAKRRLRDVYYRLNGNQAREAVPPAVRDELAARYAAPNAELATQLTDAGIALPGWLVDQTGSRGRLETTRSREPPAGAVPADPSPPGTSAT